MKRFVIWLITIVGAVTVAAPLYSAPLDPTLVQSAFSPYGAEPPGQDSIPPGTTIDQHTWQVARSVLPPEILHLVRAGDFSLTVQGTTDLPPPRPVY